PHPCGSRPHNRTHPAFDSFPRSVGPTFCRAEPCSAQMFRISKYSISMESHPRMAWIVSTKVDTYQQQQETVEGGALWVCGV
ncbi:hypothetical protein, partial [Stenotrophomonas sepilia]|uniref:hypothetical protein n=1 Tax=Stenotrophomonas sepilia TaxID=2860290 RepID=UPI00289BFD14